MRDRVCEVFEAFFGLIVEANEIALSRERSDPLRLPKLRVRLSGMFINMPTEVAELIRACTSGSETETLVKEFQDRFNDERRKIIMHQAKWPAPEMAAKREEYEKDVRSLFGMHEEHHQWRMRMILPLLSV
ncbi:MAG: hypothetical protein C0429_09065 [Sphingopyxis sp.]|jgi:hypothetical protein|nr:hypothetical protein [Sphingopyxis sp.]